ncbi:hypothetical protein SARC_05419 [Sphaeroforma arctica JP610]|uniref:Uncharacterized protein n=1 Tax=Sphaeroforma arctica JP610 TaxID=667725 RepID=A0A0L0FZP9_9EUKA|nr:hypothetical protein SARC_05419 [Sphaeroforma arctica JP610]KNC82300.1 hypothetical protein SARC_05419 [Sphaeroforma arctica JP610]|eukprot:XP_014156202.1 hypothetical protein SARC_05419 [Sphaeroforma arctica JP610]
MDRIPHIMKQSVCIFGSVCQCARTGKMSKIFLILTACFVATLAVAESAIPVNRRIEIRNILGYCMTANDSTALRGGMSTTACDGTAGHQYWIIEPEESTLFGIRLDTSDDFNNTEVDESGADGEVGVCLDFTTGIEFGTFACNATHDYQYFALDSYKGGFTIKQHVERDDVSEYCVYSDPESSKHNRKFGLRFCPTAEPDSEFDEKFVWTFHTVHE